VKIRPRSIENALESMQKRIEIQIKMH